MNQSLRRTYHPIKSPKASTKATAESTNGKPKTTPTMNLADGLPSSATRTRCGPSSAGPQSTAQQGRDVTAALTDVWAGRGDTDHFTRKAGPGFDPNQWHSL
jgi:hypothetical protein